MARPDGGVGAALRPVLPRHRLWRHAAHRRAGARPAPAASDGDGAVQRRHRRRPALAVPAGAAQPDRAVGRGDAGLLRGGQPQRPPRGRPRRLQRHAVQDRRLLRQGALLLLRGADPAAGPAGRDAGVVLRRPGACSTDPDTREVRQITLVLHVLHRSTRRRPSCMRKRRAAARPAETIGRRSRSRRPVHGEHSRHPRRARPMRRARARQAQPPLPSGRPQPLAAGRQPVGPAAHRRRRACGCTAWRCGPWVTLLGFLGVLYTMFRWWRDVLAGVRQRRPQRRGRQGPAPRHGAVHHLRGVLLLRLLLGLLLGCPLPADDRSRPPGRPRASSRSRPGASRS